MKKKKRGGPLVSQNQGWEIFTDTLIQTYQTMEGLIFLLWGGLPKRKQKIDRMPKAIFLTSDIQSAFECNRGILVW